MALNGSPTGHQGTFASTDDEVSLTQSQARQEDGAMPDSLEVRSDALAILQESIGPMRVPMMIVGAVGGAAVLAMAGASLIGWLRHRPGAATA